MFTAVVVTGVDFSGFTFRKFQNIEVGTAIYVHGNLVSGLLCFSLGNCSELLAIIFYLIIKMSNFGLIHSVYYLLQM